LVTEIAASAEEISYVGTKGYTAPEGPGTPAADIYGLAKVLYEVITGLDRSPLIGVTYYYGESESHPRHRR